jgi:hypothetical protein
MRFVAYVAALAAALVASSIGNASAQVAFSTDRIEPGPSFDSGWRCTDNSRQRLPIQHKLGAAPRFFTAYFAPSADSSQVFPLNWSWSRAHSGNPVTIEITTENLYLHIHDGDPLHGVWDAGSATWQRYNRGCFRVFMQK